MAKIENDERRVERVTDVLVDAQREYQTKAEDAARYAERIASDLTRFAAEIRRRAAGEPTAINFLGVIQSQGYEMDRKVGELGVMEQNLAKLNWALGRPAEEILGGGDAR